MKLFLLSMALICLLTAPTVVHGEEYDFRSIYWGMSREEVIEQEGSPIRSDEGIITYEENVFGVNMFLNYRFYDNKLAKAEYVSKEDYMAQYGQYVNDYTNLKGRLKDRYGEPMKNVRHYSNPAYKDMGDSFNLQLGYLTAKSEWETEATNISHFLYNTGRTGQYGQAVIAHAIFYTSVKHTHLIEQAEQQEAEEKL